MRWSAGAKKTIHILRSDKHVLGHNQKQVYVQSTYTVFMAVGLAAAVNVQRMQATSNALTCTEMSAAATIV